MEEIDCNYAPLSMYLESDLSAPAWAVRNSYRTAFRQPADSALASFRSKRFSLFHLFETYSRFPRWKYWSQLLTQCLLMDFESMRVNCSTSKFRKWWNLGFRVFEVDSVGILESPLEPPRRTPTLKTQTHIKRILELSVWSVFRNFGSWSSPFGLLRISYLIISSENTGKRFN